MNNIIFQELSTDERSSSSTSTQTLQPIQDQTKNVYIRQQESPLLIFIKHIIHWLFDITPYDINYYYSLCNRDRLLIIMIDIIEFTRSSVERQVIALIILFILLLYIIRKLYRFKFY